MQYLDEFLAVFGDITIADAMTFILACAFLFAIYKSAKKYFNTKIEEQNKRATAEKERDEQLKEALDAVRKYPEYRQQSIRIQQLLEGEIQELRDLQQETSDRLAKMEETTERRDRNKLRDLLLQNYRHYTNSKTNPSHSWTRMEAEAFWELFHDYEEAGGDGYMHTDVQPEMERLLIIEVGK